jgi:hypothetical protein
LSYFHYGMNRPILGDVIFRNRFHVHSATLIERYNRVLHHLTGHQTSSTDIYINIFGHSPKVGEKLRDPLHLGHKGVNRQFILLAVDQRTLSCVCSATG